MPARGKDAHQGRGASSRPSQTAAAQVPLLAYHRRRRHHRRHHHSRRRRRHRSPPSQYPCALERSTQGMSRSLATISTMIFPFGCFAPNTVAQYLPSAGSFSKHPPSGKWAFDAAVAPIAIDSLLTLHLFQGHCCLEALPLLGHLHCTHGGKGLGVNTVKDVKGRNPRARFNLNLKPRRKTPSFPPFFPFFFFLPFFFPSLPFPFPPLPAF